MIRNSAIHQLQRRTIALLEELVRTPSFSKEEDQTAAIIQTYLQEYGIASHRFLNNVWAIHPSYDIQKPTLLLNSHHDTVKPNTQYTRDPFAPTIENGILYGLGSNDAGGCLVSLLAAFVFFSSQAELPFNLVLAATAEEEISGKNGIEALLTSKEFLSSLHLQEPSFNRWCGIVGEPTQMNLAVAEKGLLVVDVTVEGKAGHAAREEGINAIYKAMKDISWIEAYRFSEISNWLGPVKMSVTVIQTDNRAHNMVPENCTYTIDIRVNDCYTHEQIIEVLQNHLQGSIRPRSIRLRSTSINTSHPLVVAALQLGGKPYGSPTCSDKALMPFPTLKMGPGDSARSHTADEYILLSEIESGIMGYIEVIGQLKPSW
ncbi:MAG: M20 family metallo-hydrolase [Hydrotalea sp.]|nr:M20 family metallo-hydrolase [Hydrotalea sp.]